MSFKEIYESMQKTYSFRIKSVCRLADEEMDVIERVIDKYRPSKISKLEKMMFQTSPLGFTGVQNVEVYYLDVELTVPAHAPTLAYDLRTAFGLAPNSPLIQVQGEDEDANEDNEEQIENNDKHALLTDPTNSEYEVNKEESFGDSYNKSFLAYVKKVEEERSAGMNVDAPHPITKWEDQPKDQNKDIDITHFNDHLSNKQEPFTPKAKLPSPRDEK